MLKLFALYVYLQALFCGCGPDRRQSGFIKLRSGYHVKVERIGSLDKRIKESSGLSRASDSTFWTNPDSGHKSSLYEFNLDGALLKTITLPLPNQDWEDLAQDGNGHLYIGDFGNNLNKRKNLRIYKVQQNTWTVSDTLHFSFGNQTSFPPHYGKRHFDLEAFFYHTDSLFLFTKSRARKSITQLYTLPATSGNYILKPKATLRLKSEVTAADILPGHNQFALLGYGRLYLFHNSDKDSLGFNGKRYCLPLGRTGQAEAIQYLDAGRLLITNENGSLYLVTLKRKN